MRHNPYRNWFSNFFPFSEPLAYDGVLYPTPEHFFQAMKTADPDKRKHIASRKTPGQAKRAGRAVELIDNWETYKYDVMEFVQRYRFKREPAMLERLLATTGEIVEVTTWHDRTWGKCVCSSCNGQGQNMLGQILMKIRDEV